VCACVSLYGQGELSKLRAIRSASVDAKYKLACVCESAVISAVNMSINRTVFRLRAQLLS